MIFIGCDNFPDPPLNILFSNASLMWAGNEKWTLRAAETLHARGHNVAIAVRDARVWTPHLHAPIELLPLTFLNDADVRTILGLRKLLKSRSVDVFLPTRSRDYWLGGWANLGTRAIYVMRNGITRDLKNNLKEHFRYGWFPDGIVVNAQAVKDSLARYPWVKADRIRVIYNGVDESSPPIHGRTKGVSDKTFRIVAAGRVETDKGFDTLIEAFAIAIKDAPDMHLTIYGKGDQEEPLSKLIAERGLAGTAELGGFVNPLSSVLHDADLAVSSSRREGVSNFILEAWSAGVPVIATDLPGSAEIVTDGVRGRIVPVDNTPKMAAAILEAYRDQSLRARWAAAGREAIETTFNWTHMAEELEHFFEELMRRKHATR